MSEYYERRDDGRDGETARKNHGICRDLDQPLFSSEGHSHNIAVVVSYTHVKVPVGHTHAERLQFRVFSFRKQRTTFGVMAKKGIDY